MGMTYERGSFAADWEEAKPLAAADWDEMIPYKRSAKYDLDESKYAAFEAAGALRVYIGRRDGRMVGYIVFLVSAGSLHARSTPRAMCIDWYVIPDERAGFAGYRLKQFAENALRDEGVFLVVIEVMAESHAAIRLLEATGYWAGGLSYVKSLREREDA